eukprot:6951606-Alexandrium_andersonii.AAC.1
MEDFDVWEDTDWKSVPDNAKVIDMRWVLRRKPDGSVRARIVGRDFATDTRDDVYAATPTVMTSRVLKMRAAQQKRKRWKCD